MNWRVIKLETHDAHLNMAIDNALLEGIRDGTSLPTIRFYRWMPSAVSIGNFQSMRDEVDIDRCKQLGVSYVRRITGGGAVYHDNEGEITYSVTAPDSSFPKNIIESYGLICGWVISGLYDLGIDSQFAPINDIVASGKKISGNAQTRREGALLQHGTVLYKLDLKKMFSVLKVSNEKISDKLIKSVEERVTSVSERSDATLDGLYGALLKGFTAGKQYEFGTLDKDEMKRAEQLKQEIYSTDSWNFSR